MSYDRGTCSKSSPVFCRCPIWFLGKNRKKTQKIDLDRYISTANFSILKFDFFRINMQAPCGVASNWKERHGSTPQIYTTLDHILAHLLSVSLTHQKHVVLQGQSNCVACWQVSFGVLWTVLQASLTDFTKCSPVKAPVKLTYLTICARWKSSVCLLHKRILGSVLRDQNRNKTSRQKRVQLAGLGGWSRAQLQAFRSGNSYSTERLRKKL